MKGAVDGTSCAIALTVLGLVAPLVAFAQAPPFETKKITENVYVFRYGGHQSVFVVTPDGGIVTDPIARKRTAAGQGKCFDAAMEEIKLPTYEKWDSYHDFLPGNIERFCEY